MRRSLTALALAGALLTGCAGGAEPSRDTGDGRLAMISGRDDHGLVAQDKVPLYDAPNGVHVEGNVHDGTLVRVVQREGTAMRVTTLEGDRVIGWTDDFYLRGQVRLVGAPPECRSAIGRTPVDGGTLVLGL